MSDPILRRFLEKSWGNARALAERSDILELVPVDGDPPSTVIAHFRAGCYVMSANGPRIHEGGFTVGFRFPDRYLSAVLPWEMAQVVGPLNLWHPNVRPPAICLGRPSCSSRKSNLQAPWRLPLRWFRPFARNIRRLSISESRRWMIMWPETIFHPSMSCAQTSRVPSTSSFKVLRASSRSIGRFVL